MDAEIAVDWMGEVLKALARWFMPKDTSSFPDAPHRFLGAGGVGVAGIAGIVGVAGGAGGVGHPGDPVFAPYVPMTMMPDVRLLRTVAQPIYDTDTIPAGGADFYTVVGYTDGGGNTEFDTATGNG